MAQHKIIFTGPVGAGKTTAIASLSDIPPVTTDARASDMTADRKSHTTVAMDYGVMKISPTEQVHLYGTPGQERFDFMWEILQQGAIGLVLMLDNTRPNAFGQMRFFLDAFRDFIATTKVVIGITRMDEAPTPTVADYQAELASISVRAPVFEVDARNRDDVATLVAALLYSLDPGIANDANA